jgi:formylglycine-generating enzyme required for sulfatase activity
LFAHLESAVSNASNQTQTPQRWVLRQFQSGDFFFLSPTGGIPPKPERPLPAGTETMDPMAIDVIEREYKATVNARVRKGPGTAFETIKTLRQGDRVWVTGKVKDKNWYQVELTTGVGYIFARLLAPITVGTSKPPPVSAFGPEMVVVPAGTFLMGSEDGRKYERPVHRVAIDRFAIGKYEVTFTEYDKFAAASGRKKPDDEGWGRGNRPVINVSWDDAKAYSEWLSKETGKHYRLPSEAEWEYAARAGSTTQYPWDDEIGRNRANCNGCGSRWDAKSTAPVGSFAANAFGLFDTVGNVWEWVEDCWHKSYEGSPKDGSAWISGGECESRVLRGGSWSHLPIWARSASRDGINRGLRFNGSGFRVAQDL